MTVGFITLALDKTFLGKIHFLKCVTNALLARLDSQTYSEALFIHVILIRKHESDIELAEIVANFPEDLY